MRGPTRHFTHSKVMAWVAFDRAVRMHEEFGRDGPVERWRRCATRSTPRCSRAAGATSAQAFTQSYGSDELDASVLMMPLVGFLPATDPRFVSTVEAIRRELDGRRARAPLPHGRGRRRRRAAAGRRRLPARARSGWSRCSRCRDGTRRRASCSSGCSRCATTSGCWRRSTTRASGRQLGNFPQAFTHLALVEAALALGR